MADVDTIQYKGFEIQAAPYQLDDSGEWQVNLRTASNWESRSSMASQPTAQLLTSSTVKRNFGIQPTAFHAIADRVKGGQPDNKL
jgi:hypothetical protein